MLHDYGSQVMYRLEKERLERKLRTAWMFPRDQKVEMTDTPTAGKFTTLLKYLRRGKWVT